MARIKTTRIAMDPQSWARFTQKLQRLEKVAKREIVDKALAAGGDILQAEAQASAPGPGIIAEVSTGRTLKKRRSSAGVKANARVVAVGPDEKHWHYRWAEFGAKPHDVSVSKPGFLRLYPLGIVRAWAKMAGGIRKFAFLRRAFDSKGSAAIDAMKRVLAKEIERAARS